MADTLLFSFIFGRQILCRLENLFENKLGFGYIIPISNQIFEKMATEVPAIVVEEVKDVEKCPEENLKAKVVPPAQENGSGDAPATNGKNGDNGETKVDGTENGSKKEEDEKESADTTADKTAENAEDKTATKRPAEQVEGEKETEEVKKQKTEEKVEPSAENGKTEEPVKAAE